VGGSSFEEELDVEKIVGVRHKGGLGCFISGGELGQQSAQKPPIDL